MLGLLSSFTAFSGIKAQSFMCCRAFQSTLLEELLENGDCLLPFNGKGTIHAFILKWKYLSVTVIGII